MNKKKLTLSIALGGLLIQGVFASDSKGEVEEFDLDSIEYIEEEEVIELGFDTADYLPEGFDPYAFYFDVHSITYIEESDLEDIHIKNYLPKGFDAYADPIGIEGINYVDSNDEIMVDFNTKKYLPKEFDPYKGM
ncbi:MAG: hypothetical protein ACR2MT_05825 [Aurantibacter sp.]